MENAKQCDWSNYEKTIAMCKPQMLRSMKRLARRLHIPAKDVWESDCDDFRIEFEVSRRKRFSECAAKYPDQSNAVEWDTKLGVSFSIWDSGDADDGVYGKHGNFVFDIVEHGGRIIGQIIPENYSDRVWIDYTDVELWRSRCTMVCNGIESYETFEMISKWRNGKR